MQVSPASVMASARSAEQTNMVNFSIRWVRYRLLNAHRKASSFRARDPDEIHRGGGDYRPLARYRCVRAPTFLASLLSWRAARRAPFPFRFLRSHLKPTA